METSETKKGKVTRATVLDMQDKVIKVLKPSQAYYHLRKGDLKLVCQEGSRMVLKCRNSNIETLLTSAG